MTVRQAHLADQSLFREISDEEWQAARGEVHVRWLDVSDAELCAGLSALDHFDASSLHFYLPAYLRFSVRHVGADLLSAEGELLGSIVHTLTHKSAYNLARLSGLADEQKHCVVSVLRWIAAHSQVYASDAQKGLDRLWLNPEGWASVELQIPT
ncbi:hypothetical protein IP84_10155 [beta proteobacterium AAP99]|nr:hypothetical protein IP84_10155 [beta proteobacterium AAP99]